MIEATVGSSRQAVTLVGPFGPRGFNSRRSHSTPHTRCPRGPTEKAAASYADECRFDSCRGHAPQSWLRSSVVEHPPVERKVAGSIPVGVAQYPRVKCSRLHTSLPNWGSGFESRHLLVVGSTPGRARPGSWACGVTGSAPPLQGEDCRFESDQVHVSQHARVAQSGGSSSLIRNRSEVQILPRARIPGWSAGMADEVLALGIVGSIPAPGALGFLAQPGERTGEDRDVGVRVPGKPRCSELPRWLSGKAPPW